MKTAEKRTYYLPLDRSLNTIYFIDGKKLMVKFVTGSRIEMESIIPLEVFNRHEHDECDENGKALM